MFKSMTEKSYNLDLLIDKIKKNLIKKDNNINKEQLDKLVITITQYTKVQLEPIPNKLYKNDNKDLLDVAYESEKKLSQIFSINNLYSLLELKKREPEDNIKSKRYIINKFEADDDFRRNVMKMSLYKLIDIGGKEQCPEYSLLFAKIFNFDIAIPMRYASYGNIYDERFIKYLDTYLGIGGSENIYWLPNYFKEDNKSKYNMEELSYIRSILREYINKNKVNSKR